MSDMKIKIYFPKISPDHNDSFWYEGLIADTDKAEMWAVGEIRIINNKTGNIVYDGKERNEGLPQNILKNDKGIDKVYAGEGNYYFENNNWFEVVEKKAYGDLGAVFETYDQALEALRG